jgi:tartrate-resistant acid phosphatase type 5
MKNLPYSCLLALCLLGPASPATAKTPAVPPAELATDICGALLAGSPRGEQPPVILAADRPVRVLAFGDFGDGSWGQMRVAGAIARHNRREPLDFGITLGDNFYPKGLVDLLDPRWQRDWEGLYSRLGIRFYATLGNHDHYSENSPETEIQRSSLSASWCLPKPYYTFTAGPIQFFALDTNPIRKREPSSDEQLEWLDRALAASSARWKVVYGHHPIFSTGPDGNTEEMVGEVLPVLKRHGADVYLAGHEHIMEYLKPEGGLSFFISGAGGHALRRLGKDGDGRRRWAAGKTLGFLVLEAEAGGDSLQLSFFDVRSSRLCRVKLVKGAEAEVECGR